MVLHRNEDDRRRPGFGYHVKVHSFRAVPVILAWVLIFAAFYEKAELPTGAQRALQRGIEAVGDAIPPPWGRGSSLSFGKSAVSSDSKSRCLFCPALSPRYFPFITRVIFRSDQRP